MELMLSIVIAGAIFGIAAETMMRQADTYSFIANRKTSIADVRYAVKRINHELLRIESEDITSISSSGISFVDENGQNTDFSLGSDGADLAIFRGNDVLVPKVSAFDIEYQTGTGTALQPTEDQIENIRRIKVTITTEPIGNEGAISVSTTVIPRSFIGYANYQ